MSRRSGLPKGQRIRYGSLYASLPKAPGSHKRVEWNFGTNAAAASDWQRDGRADLAEGRSPRSHLPYLRSSPAPANAPRSGKTLGEVVSEWFEGRYGDDDTSVSRQIAVEAHIRCWILPHFGAGAPFASITAADVRAFRDHLAARDDSTRPGRTPHTFTSPLKKTYQPDGGDDAE